MRLPAGHTGRLHFSALEQVGFAAENGGFFTKLEEAISTGSRSGLSYICVYRWRIPVAVQVGRHPRYRHKRRWRPAGRRAAGIAGCFVGRRLNIRHGILCTSHKLTPVRHQRPDRAADGFINLSGEVKHAAVSARQIFRSWLCRKSRRQLKATGLSFTPPTPVDLFLLYILASSIGLNRQKALYLRRTVRATGGSLPFLGLGTGHNGSNSQRAQ
jgi:hypothetical protein